MMIGRIVCSYLIQSQINARRRVETTPSVSPVPVSSAFRGTDPNYPSSLIDECKDVLDGTHPESSSTTDTEISPMDLVSSM